MPFNDSQALFYTGWDIDQLIYQGSQTVTGTLASFAKTDILIFTHNLGYPPVHDIVFFVSGATKWQQGGDVGGDNIIYGSYVTGTELHLVLESDSFSSVNYNTQIRYYIWSDTVVH